MLIFFKFSYFDSVMIDDVFVSDTLKDPEFVRDVLERFVIVGLELDLLHGHNITSGVVDRRVHFAKMALPCFLRYV